jgi:hypothetical protein
LSLTYIDSAVNAKEGKKRKYGKGGQSEEPIAPIQDIVKNEEETLKKYKVKQVEDADMQLDERPGSIMNSLSSVREVGAIDPIKDFRAMIDKEGDFIEEGEMILHLYIILSVWRLTMIIIFSGATNV